MLFWLLLLYIVEISILIFWREKLIASLDYTVGSRDQNSKYDVFYSSLCTFLLSL